MLNDIPPIDRVMPNGQWKFDDNVATVFDDMLARSIPQYEVMRQACCDMAAFHVQPHTAIVDLGCSRGEAIAPLVEQFEQNYFIGIEASPPHAPSGA